eukprot:TRINITY_DN14949_c0_g1_i1.p1 TRINITY_DN14949_c0_g1~~TRINITY_DN14949_c0_g1_i1.p1  ORF type:complete len:231 (+),score=62.06 TRINITY_DN14949_c0_g1_i1:80-772(+)
MCNAVAVPTNSPVAAGPRPPVKDAPRGRSGSLHAQADAAGRALAAAAHGSAHRTSRTVFDAPWGVEPTISIQMYLRRWTLHVIAGPEVIVIALVYMFRSGIRICPASAHRLLLAALVLAVKWRTDRSERQRNSYFASVGGVSLTELNELERELLVALDWRLTVTEEEYAAVCALIETSSGCSRWLSAASAAARPGCKKTSVLLWAAGAVRHARDAAALVLRLPPKLAIGS